MTADYLRANQPDILEVIANLSNDAVFTPPRVVNAVLDLLPTEVWSDPTLRWLDPGAKTGVFPREITKRLMVGLADAIPSEEARLSHILTEMIFAIATEEITGMMTRRSLYCSKDASGEFSTVHFADPDGNVWRKRVKHSFDPSGRCRECKGVEDQLLQPGHDNKAYGFIHADGRTQIDKEMNMKFDVIVGNPPYQMEDSGHSASATPIYQLFVEAAINLAPKYVLMITPSRWFVGGKGLDSFRDRMLHDRRLKVLIDFPNLYEPFPLVKIRGGISYFLWERDYSGPCTVQTMKGGMPDGPAVARFLDEYDVLVRDNRAVEILEKIRLKKVRGKPEPTLDSQVSQGKPFGLRTFFHGASSPKGMKSPVKLYGSQKISWIERGQIPQNGSWVDEWKVLMTAVQGTSAAVETMFLSKPIIAGPGEACTETYVVAARYDTEEQAQHFAKYLRTRLVRYLVSLRKVTQHATRNVYAFVPSLPIDREWTDEELYKRYGITDVEQAYIEEVVREMAE